MMGEDVGEVRKVRRGERERTRRGVGWCWFRFVVWSVLEENGTRGLTCLSDNSTGERPFCVGTVATQKSHLPHYRRHIVPRCVESYHIGLAVYRREKTILLFGQKIPKRLVIDDRCQ